MTPPLTGRQFAGAASRFTGFYDLQQNFYGRAPFSSVCRLSFDAMMKSAAAVLQSFK
ncbi:MAG: hypothetical protein NZM00_03625 [Anaerolinea sp.]|nr:hypothetical protein [Anaerolinea sp.]